MPLFGAVPRGRLSRGNCSTGGREEWVFKRKSAGSVARTGEELFFWVGAWRFQDVSQDNGLGKEQAVPRYRTVSLTTRYCGLCQVSVA